MIGQENAIELLEKADEWLRHANDHDAIQHPLLAANVSKGMAAAYRACARDLRQTVQAMAAAEQDGD